MVDLKAGQIDSCSGLLNCNSITFIFTCAVHNMPSLQSLHSGVCVSPASSISTPWSDESDLLYTATLGSQPILLCLRKISDAQAESDLSLLPSRIREPTARELCGAVQIMPWSGQTQPGCDVGPSATNYLKDKYILLSTQQLLYTIPYLHTPLQTSSNQQHNQHVQNVQPSRTHHRYRRRNCTHSIVFLWTFLYRQLSHS